MENLIKSAELFLIESDTHYLYPSSISILRHELGKAKDHKSNELETYLIKFRKLRGVMKARTIEEQTLKRESDYQMYCLWRGEKSPKEVLKCLGKIQKQFETLSHKEMTFLIGNHTQRKYRLQNRINGLVRLINMIEVGFKRDNISWDSTESFSPANKHY